MLHMYYDTMYILEVQQNIQSPISTAVTTSIQSLLSTDQHHHVMSSSEWITQYLVAVDSFHAYCRCKYNPP